MDDQDPPIDVTVRRLALQQAIAFITARGLMYTPDDVIVVAGQFYQFLKGETK